MKVTAVVRFTEMLFCQDVNLKQTHIRQNSIFQIVCLIKKSLRRLIKKQSDMF